MSQVGQSATDVFRLHRCHRRPAVVSDLHDHGADPTNRCLAFRFREVDFVPSDVQLCSMFDAVAYRSRHREKLACLVATNAKAVEFIRQLLPADLANIVVEYVGELRVADVLAGSWQNCSYALKPLADLMGFKGMINMSDGDRVLPYAMSAWLEPRVRREYTRKQNMYWTIREKRLNRRLARIRARAKALLKTL